MRICRVLFCAAVLLAAASPAQAGPLAISGASGGPIMVDVTSNQEAKFRTTLRQQYDYSCGSAALATLLSSGYEDPVTEQFIFRKMFETGDKEKIRKEGFTLLDMKKFLESYGYEADGFRASLDKLASLGVPAITLLDMNGYHHFVVVKGITEQEVLVSDPAAGSTVIPRSRFEEMWNGILFLIRSNKNVGMRHFNLAREWAVRGKAPLGTAFAGRELGNMPQFMGRPVQ